MSTTTIINRMEQTKLQSRPFMATLILFFGIVAFVSALLSSLSEGVAIYYQIQIGQDLAFWYAGGVAGMKWIQIQIMFPWIYSGWRSSQGRG